MAVINTKCGYFDNGDGK